MVYFKSAFVGFGTMLLGCVVASIAMLILAS
jgi:hypothetical protein